jgi:hypothetical protein
LLGVVLGGESVVGDAGAAGCVCTRAEAALTLFLARVLPVRGRCRPL